MISAIRNLFSPPRFQAEAHALYLKIVETARQPKFYTDYAVPDTIDGRFDMIALHMFLVTNRLRKDGSPEALNLLRAVSEVFFADMDRSLREMGSTDTGVGIRVKKMSQAFYGRQLAYQTAGDDDAKMAEAILKNLYRADSEKRPYAVKISEYVAQQVAAYSKLTFSQLMSGVLPALHPR